MVTSTRTTTGLLQHHLVRLRALIHKDAAEKRQADQKHSDTLKRHKTLKHPVGLTPDKSLIHHAGCRMAQRNGESIAASTAKIAISKSTQSGSPVRQASNNQGQLFPPGKSLQTFLPSTSGLIPDAPI